MKSSAEFFISVSVNVSQFNTLNATSKLSFECKAKNLGSADKVEFSS